MSWIFHLVVTLIIIYMSKRLEKVPPGEDIHGEAVVKHGWPLKAIGLFSIYFGFAIIAIGYSLGGKPTNTRDLLSIILILCLFEGLGLILVIESFFSKVLFGEEGLDKESPWTRNYYIGWKDIDWVSYNEMLDWHIIHTTEGKKIRITKGMKGVNSLFNFMSKKRPDLFE